MVLRAEDITRLLSKDAIAFGHQTVSLPTRGQGPEDWMPWELFKRRNFIRSRLDYGPFFPTPIYYTSALYDNFMSFRKSLRSTCFSSSPEDDCSFEVSVILSYRLIL